MSGVPLSYQVEALAQRWHVPPWVIEDAPLEWVMRGLEFMRLEGSVKRG